MLSLDISSDSKLIVTCSADKNIKIWGLDFGDCHKSIFAHDESIMQVAFEKEIDYTKGDKGHSHYLWTASKDKMLKYWDGDKVCKLKILLVKLSILMRWPSSLIISKNSMATMEKSGLWL